MADEPKRGRWIRLDTTWSSSEWVAGLAPEARLCWVELLCHMKAHGYAGKVKALAPSVAARLWGVTRNAVVTMLEAAKTDRALETQGDEWVVTGWDTYQPDKSAPDRQRRYRQRAQQDAELSTPGTVTPVTRNARDVTPTETETETTEELPPASGADGTELVVGDWRSTTPGTWTGGNVVAAYVEYCHRRGLPEPPPPARAKQGAAGKRIAEHHSPSDIVRAMIGIGTLFPHCPPRNEPWDLFDLERKFTKAHAAAANEPGLREAAFDEAFMRRAS